MEITRVINGSPETLVLSEAEEYAVYLDYSIRREKAYVRSAVCDDLNHLTPEQHARLCHPDMLEAIWQQAHYRDQWGEELNFCAAADRVISRLVDEMLNTPNEEEGE